MNKISLDADEELKLAKLLSDAYREFKGIMYRRGAWKTFEDERLLQLYLAYGKNPKRISFKMIYEFGKECKFTRLIMEKRLWKLLSWGVQKLRIKCK